MENKIPIPTDNIYKFYALFGLVLFIFCIGAFLYTHNSTAKFLFNETIEYQTLKSIDYPTPIEKVKKELIEKKVNITTADEKCYERRLFLFLVLSVMLMLLGFLMWQFKIQPVQDETARLQLEELRLEVAALKGDKAEK